MVYFAVRQNPTLAHGCYEPINSTDYDELQETHS